MKPQPFQDGLLSAKLLLLIGDLMSDYKSGHKLVNKIRSHVDNAIVLMVLRPEAEQDALLAGYLDYLSATIFHNFSEISFKMLVTGELVSGNMGLRQLQQALASSLTSVESGDIPGQAPGKGISSIAPLGRHADRESVLTDFASLVRNDEWLSMFMALGAEVTDQNLTGYQEQLANKFGSSTGKTTVPAKRARFIVEAPREPSPRSKVNARSPAEVEEIRLLAADVVVVTVMLDAAKLVNLPRTRELSLDHHDLSPRISDLLSAAALPTRLAPGQTPEAVAQKKLDNFYIGLDKRATAVAAARTRDAAASNEAKKARALTALRKLGPLAQVLRDNPELLNQV